MTRPLALPAPDPGWAWFLDVDGTLADIAPAPDEARINRAMQQAVGALAGASGGALALITGRPIAEVDDFFSGRPLPVAGLHGAERRDASGRLHRHPFPAARLDAARRELGAVTGRHPGLVLEDKGLALALHYRGAPQLGAFAHRVARAMLPQLAGDCVLQSGKCVVEIRPAGTDKGAAIEAFMAEPPFHGRTPVFIGDDVTDEHGFAVVNRAGGHSVKVGPGPTAARWRLPDVAAVFAWLQRASPVRGGVG